MFMTTCHNLRNVQCPERKRDPMLTIGNPLVLEPKYANQIEQYKCRLVDRKDNLLYIDYPINVSTNRTTFLIDGTQLKVNFVEGESAYLFESEILGRVKRGIPMMELIYPGDEYVIKIQRRKFVRIETSVDVAIHPLNGEFKPFTSLTEDISAGGSLVKLRNKQDIGQGMLIRTLFVLPMQNGDYHYMNLTSKVVRIMKQENGDDYASLQFIDVTPQETQLLLRFSFDRQLAMKKRMIQSNE
ncbi:MAG TPA: flagellar brake domain-containing protein [Bacillus sp. (in: firmicutes)]